MSRNEQTFYEILRVLPDATLKEIKSAYRQRCMEYHPDVNPVANNKSCHEMVCKINEAYSILRDAETRKAYDDMLKSRGQYYSSTEVTKPEEQASTAEGKSDATTRPYQRSYVDEELYSYYNSVDFDEDMQEEFIFWMEEYADRYLRYVYAYYQKYKPAKNDEDLLTRLYNMFENNIEIEKRLSKKKEKRNRL